MLPIAARSAMIRRANLASRQQAQRQAQALQVAQAQRIAQAQVAQQARRQAQQRMMQIRQENLRKEQLRRNQQMQIQRLMTQRLQTQRAALTRMQRMNVAQRRNQRATVQRCQGQLSLRNLATATTRNRTAIQSRVNTRANTQAIQRQNNKTYNQNKNNEAKRNNDKKALEKKQFNEAVNANRKRSGEQLLQKIRAAQEHACAEQKKEVPAKKKPKAPLAKPHNLPEHKTIDPKIKSREEQEKMHKAALLAKIRKKDKTSPAFFKPVTVSHASQDKNAVSAPKSNNKRKNTQKLAQKRSVKNPRTAKQKSTVQRPAAEQKGKIEDEPKEESKVKHPKVHRSRKTKAEKLADLTQRKASQLSGGLFTPYFNKQKMQITRKQKEQRAENYATHHFSKFGYSRLNTKIGSNNGLDGFLIKRDKHDKIISVVAVESKYSLGGDVKLGKSKKGYQMTYKWLHETIKLMEKAKNLEVREAAEIMKHQGNQVLDNRFINVMTPDGEVEWFRFIKKTYDQRCFTEDPGDVSDGEIYAVAEDDIVPKSFRR